MKQYRLGTFEEWYQWEMKKRSSKRTWHYPTELIVRECSGQLLYKTRHTEFKESRYVPLELENKGITQQPVKPA